MPQLTGIVKWFSSEKRFGFIIDSNDVQYFAHVKAIVSGEDTLIPGQRVEFVKRDNPKGPQARQIRTIEVDGNTL